MFTGIIETMGTIRSLRSSGRGARLTVESDVLLDAVSLGDSIAVNGACLTVTRFEGPAFDADLSPESLSTTTFGRARPGDRVNLERAMRLSDRLDGHLVSGHVDGIGAIASRERTGNAVVIGIDIPRELLRYAIRKGSIAVDGVSLTINRVTPEGVQVSIIPHTAGLTTVGTKPKGAAVNIEADMLAKYVERFTAAWAEPGESGSGGVDRELLARTGFL